MEKLKNNLPITNKNLWEEFTTITNNYYIPNPSSKDESVTWDGESFYTYLDDRYKDMPIDFIHDKQINGRFEGIKINTEYNTY